MALPLDVTGGITTGHISHHADLDTAAGISSAAVFEGSPGHLARHTAIKQWYDAAYPDNPLPVVTNSILHDLAHEMAHGYANQILGFVLGTTKPDASNTGFRTTPSTIEYGSSGVFIPTSGTTYENVEFRCIVRCNAKTNVTFRDCWFRGQESGGTSDSALVECQADSTSGIVIEFCEFSPINPSQFWHGVRGRGYKVHRCEFKHVVDGVGTNRSGALDVQVTGNYIHDLSYFTPCSYQTDQRTHNDGLQVQGGSGVLIRGNTIHGNASSIVGNGSDPNASPAPNPYFPSVTGQALAFTPQSTLGAITEMTIDKNWIDYGAKGITFAKGSPAGSNIGTITDNRFGRNIALIGGLRRAIVIDPAHTYTASGNVYEDDGTAVQIYVTTSY